MKKKVASSRSGMHPVIFHRGKIRYSRTTERRIFFILTLIMMISGILYKIGVL